MTEERNFKLLLVIAVFMAIQTALLANIAKVQNDIAESNAHR